MVSQKRTYSSRDKRRGAYEQDPQQKRSKVQRDDELRLPGSSPQNRPQLSSSLLKKGLRKFGGPFSVPDDFTATGNGAHLSVFDKVLGGKSKTVKRQQSNIYGSREDFDNTMNFQSLAKKSSEAVTRSYPTPPVEVQKQQPHPVSKFLPTAKEAASSSTTQSPELIAKSTMNSKISENTVLCKQSHQPYVPKPYEADKTSTPRKDILGNRLSKRSPEAQLWSINQTESSFLRLPAEIRNQIYEEALGGNTIKIEYKTYQPNYKKIVPVFKYHCAVYDKQTDPFRDHYPRSDQVTSGFTLLNSVCRQLYHETAPLPYRLNRIAFSSYNVMVNFLLMEQRLSSQQRQAINQLCLPGVLPGENILTYLPNIDLVYLGVEQPLYKPRGWYRVVRRAGAEPKLVSLKG